MPPPPMSPRYYYRGYAGLAGLVPDDEPMEVLAPVVRCRRCDVEVDVPASVAAEFTPLCGGPACSPPAPVGAIKRLPDSYKNRT